MTPADRWIFIAVVVTWTVVVFLTGYAIGVQSHGASFGFY